jgi:hypothetical protein
MNLIRVWLWCNNEDIHTTFGCSPSSDTRECPRLPIDGFDFAHGAEPGW